MKNTVKLFFVCFLLSAFPLICMGDTSWKFIISGDTRSGGENNGVNTVILGELADEIINQNADFVLFTGDLVNGGVDQTTLESQFNTWRSTMQSVYGADIGVYVVRGNHDIGSPAGTTAWNNVFADLPDNGPSGEVNLTYSVRHKNALVIGLDQYITSHRVNQIWLDAQFAANTSPHIFVFGHEPAFKVEHVDCLDASPANRNTFWFSIENAGGRTYFCGHDHFYNHAQLDNDGEPNNDIHQYVVGTGGAPIRPWSGYYDGTNDYYNVEEVNHIEQYGYVVCEVNDLDVTLTWMERIGAGTYSASEIWSYTAALAGDFNNDGVVDFKDFAILANNWLKTI